VGGIVIMEQTQNALQITHALKERIAEIGASLPQGVEIRPTYDRSQLIWGTLKHFFVTLVYELAVVIVVTVLFLRNARTAIAPVSILLLGVLFTAMPLAAFGQTINLFSLAGLFIAIGEMVDATIVIVENCTAELAAHPAANEKEKRRIILQSIAGVARPLLFSLLIILASFLPVFFLSDKEADVRSARLWQDICVAFSAAHLVPSADRSSGVQAASDQNPRPVGARLVTVPPRYGMGRASAIRS
jgi:Cu(I)/Ag(I) efflux system membrane protein CusA/SilA